MLAIWFRHSTIPLYQKVSQDASPDAVAHEITDVLAIVESWNDSPDSPDARADGVDA
jgi:putative hydrolase of the HAD superfamily